MQESLQSQIKSRKRIADHGEVFTSDREVNAMLDLVKSETDRIDSRFLEPACGTGNFLVEILKRKLIIVTDRYSKNQIEWERYAVIAISSIYGVDILQDNVGECRKRLFWIFNEQYTILYWNKCQKACLYSAWYILSRNILWGDALSLRRPWEEGSPIIFSEWSAVNGSMMKRRDFKLDYLLDKKQQRKHLDDSGNATHLPEPFREFPVTHFLKLSEHGTEL